MCIIAVKTHFLDWFTGPWKEWIRTILPGLKTNPCGGQTDGLGILVRASPT